MLANCLPRSSTLHLGPIHLVRVAPRPLNRLQRVINERVLCPCRLAAQARQRIDALLPLGQQLQTPRPLCFLPLYLGSPLTRRLDFFRGEQLGHALVVIGPLFLVLGSSQNSDNKAR